MAQPIVKKPKKQPVFSEPKIEARGEQPYVGIRTQVPMRQMRKVIGPLFVETFAWLRQRGIPAAGAPFVRYHVINMAGLMDIEMGVPVSTPVTGDERVKAGTLPAGRYAALVYTGVNNGIKGNGALLDWAKAQGLTWDRWDEAEGDAFRSRYERQLTDPDDEPDKAKWETEVAIRLADEPMGK